MPQDEKNTTCLVVQFPNVSMNQNLYFYLFYKKKPFYKKYDPVWRKIKIKVWCNLQERTKQSENDHRIGPIKADESWQIRRKELSLMETAESQPFRGSF